MAIIANLTQKWHTFDTIEEVRLQGLVLHWRRGILLAVLALVLDMNDAAVWRLKDHLGYWLDEVLVPL